MLNTRCTHLFRGSPAVRAWSKYQQTVPRWALCGIDREKNPRNPANASENPVAVNCAYCRELMRVSE